MESLLIYEGIFSRTPTSKAQSFRIKDHVGGRLIFLVALPLLKHNHSAIKTKWEGDLFNHSATKTKWQGNLFF